jgi:hypothetical protein
VGIAERFPNRQFLCLLARGCELVKEFAFGLLHAPCGFSVTAGGGHLLERVRSETDAGVLSRGEPGDVHHVYMISAGRDKGTCNLSPATSEGSEANSIRPYTSRLEDRKFRGRRV